MAWLSDWAKRVKLTIDSGDITAGLANFPMLLYLSTSSGRGPDDISFIFDELGSDANRKKIAVTISDGQTQCYVEIEKWDHGGEKAWLWVKVPSIASDADTDLYLYYDSGKADNTTYVGDCADGSAATHAVWDSDFKMVLHMEGASATEIDDSTGNNNDVSGDNGTPLYQQAGKIGNAVDFEKASSEYLTVPDAVALDLTGDFTIEAWARPDAFADIKWHVMVGKEHWNNSTGYLVMMDAEQPGILTLSGETDSDLLMPWGTSLSIGTWYYLVMKLTSGTLDVLLNTVSEGTEAAHTVTANAQDLLIGSRHANDGGPGNDYFDGVIDEVRISAISRNAAWIKASYECQVDDLLDWGSEETPGGVDYPVSVSLSRSAGVAASAVAAALGSASLSRSLGLVGAGQSTALASASLARALGLTDEGQAAGLGSVALGRDGAISAVALAEALAAVSLAKRAGLSASGLAQVSAATLLEIFEGLSFDAVKGVELSITLERLAGVSVSSQAASVATAVLALILEVDTNALASASGSVILTKLQAILVRRIIEVLVAIGFIEIAEALMGIITITEARVGGLTITETLLGKITTDELGDD